VIDTDKAFLGAGTRVLVITTQWWPPAARVAASLADLGLSVASVSPPGAAIRQLQTVRSHFPYRHWARPNSIERAIQAWRPDFLVCADDQAVFDLHRLHRETSQANYKCRAGLADLIETSIGDSSSFAFIGAKSSLIPYALSLGLRCPKTNIVANDDTRERSLSAVAYPVVVKVDGSWGGMGVRLANEETQARAIISAFQAKVSWYEWFKNLLSFSKQTRSSFYSTQFVRGPKKLISLQEYITGRPANRAVACQKGKVLAGISVEVLECVYNFGPASVVRIIDCPEMTAATEALVRHLNLSGFFGFDFIVDPQNQAWLVEVNSRLTPTSHFLLKGGSTVAVRSSSVDEENTFFETGHEISATIALFPQELQRTSRSTYLHSSQHDVPWSEPLLVRGCFDTIIGLSLKQRLRRKMGI
jgi:hypothetical protein